jgi:hypothetical protein
VLLRRTIVARALALFVPASVVFSSLAGCGYTVHVFQAPTRTPFLGRYVQKHYFRVMHPIRLQTGGLWSQLVISDGPPVLAYEYCSTNQPRFHYPGRHDSDSLGTWTGRTQFAGPYQANMQVDPARQNASDYAQDYYHSDVPSGRYRGNDDDDRQDHHHGADGSGGTHPTAIFDGHYLMPGAVLRAPRVYVYRHEIMLRADLMGEYSFTQHVRILISSSQTVLPPWAEVLKRLRYYLLEIPKPKPMPIAVSHVSIVATPSVVVPATDGSVNAPGHH